MALVDLFSTISQHFRGRRIDRFIRGFHVTPATRILDVGGLAETWRLLPQSPRVTLLNTPRTQAELASTPEWVAGDGCSLPFRDHSFDIVFSNSAIEHVGSAARQ